MGIVFPSFLGWFHIYVLRTVWCVVCGVWCVTEYYQGAEWVFVLFMFSCRAQSTLHHDHHMHVGVNVIVRVCAGEREREREREREIHSHNAESHVAKPVKNIEVKSRNCFLGFKSIHNLHLPAHTPHHTHTHTHTHTYIHTDTHTLSHTRAYTRFPSVHHFFVSLHNNTFSSTFT